MKSRRDFMKTSLITAGISVGLNPLKLLTYQKEDKYRKESVVETSEDFTWRTTIFCQFDHEDLKTAMEKCALDLNCKVFYGQYPDPDIIAVPAFVVIVDRDAVGHDLWREYVEYSDQVGDCVPCFIIDSIKNLPVPTMKYVCQFDPDSVSSITTIIETIRQMRTSMDQKLPDIFKKGREQCK